jgi:hypothetical protein
MAAFCGSCGKPLDGGARFCRFCGTDSSGTTPAPPPAATHSAVSATPAQTGPGAAGGATAPAKSSNILLTILVICVVVFGGFAAVLMYAAYWAKNKVSSTAKNYGIELPSDAHSRSRKLSAAAQRDPCSFLSPAEVAAATGIAITEARTQEHTCNFASTDGTGAGAFVEFEWGSGKILMTATRAGSKLMTMAPGTEIQSVSDVGDEAYFQNGMLTVRKGDDGFRIMMPAELLSRNLGNGNRTALDNIAEMRDMEKGLAQKIVSRM